MTALTKRLTDNHNGPRFEDVRRAYPNAVRLHWFQNAFDPAHCYWYVGLPSRTASGRSCMYWETVPVESLPAA